jgi:large subunit ribosomal protein L23
MSVLLKPVITEKMTAKGESLNQYGFVVDKNANKIQIKAEVEAFYGVQVISVNTMNYSGKKKQRFTKGGVVTGRTKSTKKAIVTIAEGDSIDFFSNI